MISNISSFSFYYNCIIVLKVVQKSEAVEPVRTAVISKPEIKSAPEPEVPKPKSGSASPRVAPVDEGNPQIESKKHNQLY